MDLSTIAGVVAAYAAGHITEKIARECLKKLGADPDSIFGLITTLGASTVAAALGGTLVGSIASGSLVDTVEDVVDTVSDFFDDLF